MASTVMAPNPRGTLSDRSLLDRHVVFEYAGAQLYSLLIMVQIYLSVHTSMRFYQLPREQRQKRRRYILFLLVILPLSITRYVFYIREDIPHMLDSPGIRRYFSCPGPPAEQAISFVCTATLSLVGDAFLAWRATVIWGHHPVLKPIPAAVYIINLGVCVASTLFKFRAVQVHAIAVEGMLPLLERGRFDWDDEKHFFEVTQGAQMIHQAWRITDFSSSVMVNIVTTTLIGTRILIMRKRMKRLAKTSAVFTSTLPYGYLTALLLESSLPFTLLGIAGAILTGLLDPASNTYNPAMHAFPIVIVLWTNALALGPQLIIYRIVSGTTWTSNPRASLSRPMSQPLFFADDPVVESVIGSGYIDEFHLEQREDPPTRRTEFTHDP
ncbi:hypothetical protein BKA70DRAFT_378108 [Coprinopsis sp. MPI-PUGE-AT-0042]|nr:hypothetical protein BKA70DRAFT_378108 [Coprinopsis sp. MPI-PUGE-AT-0042]